MRSIEETTKLGTRLLTVLGVAAVVAVAAVIWAASALAGGGSTAGDPGTRDTPAAENVQNEGGGPEGDCPERDGEAEPSSAV